MTVRELAARSPLTVSLTRVSLKGAGTMPAPTPKPGIGAYRGLGRYALDNAWRLELLSPQHADVLRPAVRLYHNLTQVLRLCLPGPFDPKTAGKGLLDLLCRAADLPNFATLDAHVAETQQKVRATFNQIVSAG